MDKIGRYPQIGLICDADNTLWDTDRVYAEAQLWLLSEIERAAGARARDAGRLEYVRDVDQTLAKLHHAGLRYPSVLLAVALRKKLSGWTKEKAAKVTLQEYQRTEEDERIASQFDLKLRAIPPLRSGVIVGLNEIHQLGASILVASEGSADTVSQRLAHWNLSPLVNYVLSAPKSRELYVRAARLMNIAPSNCVVVGDQLDRDMQFGAEAGCTTVYFPGGFSPEWARKLTDVHPSFVVHAFDEVAAILRSKVDALI